MPPAPPDADAAGPDGHRDGGHPSRLTGAPQIDVSEASDWTEEPVPNSRRGARQIALQALYWETSAPGTGVAAAGELASREGLSAELGEFAGTYHSQDAETTLVITVEGGTLTVHRRPDQTSTMLPVYRDAFNVGGVGFVAAFDRESGAPVWTIDIDGEAARIAIEGDSLLLATLDGFLHRLVSVE